MSADDRFAEAMAANNRQTSDLLDALRATLASYESAQRSERIKRGMALAKARREGGER